MACLQVPSASPDSEMEEGEIIDDVDELSDISSEEEFLLRQRLQVLENYNNVLERKKAKTTIGSGKEFEKTKALYDLSEISETDVDDGVSKEIYRSSRKQKQLKPHKRRKIKQTGKENDKLKEHKQKSHHHRKKNECKVLSETSEESDDEYRNKRRKLANAVTFNKDKSDISTLKDRLTKMMCNNKNENPIITTQSIDEELKTCGNKHKTFEVDTFITVKDEVIKQSKVCDLIDLCTDDDATTISTVPQESVNADILKKTSMNNSAESSDEDLEILRQHALRTKATKITADKPKQIFTENKTAATSEDEDSDTSELRMICLKSALLKKAIEMKQKQKLQKRLSQSVNIPDEFDIASNKVNNDANNCENNTDVESVDMDIGSDGDDKGKDSGNIETVNDANNVNIENSVLGKKVSNEEEIEEDEDLLRAKLLTSLSKNLPNLVDLNVINTVFKQPISNKKDVPKHSNTIEEKKFIIQLGESDSEGEHEATKNLTEMHRKLSEQEDFQKKLDLFLKSSRMQVEQKLLPDVVQPPANKTPQKFVPKAMNHLPKSEQIEYKNLVRRMAELEKMKQARQTGIILESKTIVAKDTLKPRNVTLDAQKKIISNKLDEKIAMSRKKIAEESAKMLRLKEEAQKLSQRYKITATELRNITTAITFNKKQQRAIQNCLFKVRLQHQMLLKSATNLKSKHVSNLGDSINKSLLKVQKENNPSTKEHKDINIVKSVKVTLVNDLSNNATITHPRLSVQVDIANNRKCVKMPMNADTETKVDSSSNKDVDSRTVIDIRDDSLDENSGTVHRDKKAEIPNTHQDVTDYKSPLDALRCKNWEEDPNAFLCPYEIGGSCRDPDCKYLHPEIPTQK